MLSESSVTTMLPVKDMGRARAFYEKCLGLKPEGTKADHTTISFQVTDIAANIAALERAGVVFEDYDFPDLKTVNHICVLGAEKAAWFKDSEGNYLCIHAGYCAGVVVHLVFKAICSRTKSSTLEVRATSLNGLQLRAA